MSSFRRVSLIALVIAGACQGGVTPPPPVPSNVVMTVQANISGTTIAALTVEVSGDGIATPILRNFAVVNGTAAVTVSVPAGGNRTFTVRAYNDRAVETHRGSRTMPVQEGQNTAVSVTLAALTGEVPVDASISTFVVLLAPGHVTLALGDSVSLVASVTRSDGTAITSPSLSWGSNNPVVASVDQTGRVIAKRVGTTSVVANYLGFAASAIITVQ